MGVGHSSENENNSEMASMFVQGLLSKFKVVLITKSGCPYCTTATSIFSKYNIEPSQIHVEEISDHPECKAIQEYLHNITGAKTVPRVFIDGKCIGGCSDTEKLHKNGQLEGMLVEAGALVVD